MIDAVKKEHGQFSLDDPSWCVALVQTHFWAICRRRKLEAIHSARVMKRKGHLSGTGEESLAVKGLKDVDAFKAHFAKSGIPVMEL